MRHLGALNFKKCQNTTERKRSLSAIGGVPFPELADRRTDGDAQTLSYFLIIGLGPPSRSGDDFKPGGPFPSLGPKRFPQPSLPLIANDRTSVFFGDSYPEPGGK
jgi:hypothetical protein